MFNKIVILDYIKGVTPVNDTGDMYRVLDMFRTNVNQPVLPVVDKGNKPIGIIRERDLKPFTYGMFGRELLKRERLDHFLRQCPCVGIETNAEEVLAVAASVPECDGIIVSDRDGYCGMILPPSILAMFEENRKITDRRLSQAQKMEAIGTLAGGIAHDFNNILTPIMGYAELIQMVGIDNKDKTSAAYTNQIISAAMRAKDLINQILAFSRQKDREKIPLHLGSIVKEVSKLLRSSLPTTIAIETSVETDRDLICADPTEIHQVIMNLCTNAAHAMRETGGKLALSVTAASGQVHGWSVETGPAPAPGICLSVADTGHGIPAAVLPRIFDPFFTTKKAGEGTGMGLSVVHGIVKGCRGIVAVETDTTPGSSGTKFNLYFPLAHETPSLPCPEQDGLTALVDLMPPGKKARVLCVDDEWINVEMMRETLEVVGFAVTAAGSSVQALIEFQNAPENFDLVITDQTMPELTGMELARKILGICPEMPVMLITGYSETVSLEVAKAIGISSYMTKPFDLRKFAETAIALATGKSE